ncbi:unnamed protein product [Protopolystoma xenopodis]|uniref:Uncharacterized protein n=1 Tax=Protopolystoma xenopodis TaxID=117903 RepID=A0A448WUE0_9PLAT|nr:unnamed protein product [Protopolystoma xenopodis]
MNTVSQDVPISLKRSLPSMAYNGDFGRAWYPGGGLPPLPPLPVDNTLAGRPLELGRPRHEPLADRPGLFNDDPRSGLHQSAPVPVGYTDIKSA